MRIKVLQPGSYSCLVDLGRFHFRKYGVPSSGPMDTQSAMRAHSLVGNPTKYPLIESYLSGLHLEFDHEALCSITGGKAEILHNDVPISNTNPIHLDSGDRLKVGRMISGARTYIAIRGAIQSPHVLDSVCPLVGYHDSRLTQGEILQITTNRENKNTAQSLVKPLSIEPSTPIQVHPGQEWHLLSQHDQALLLDQEYTISRLADRMGYRLEGTPVQAEKHIEIFSSPVMPGIIQLLPSGLPLVLMRDCQTTGGYPRVLQVVEHSIMQLAQRKTHDTVRLQLVK